MHYLLTLCLSLSLSLSPLPLLPSLYLHPLTTVDTSAHLCCVSDHPPTLHNLLADSLGC